MRRCPVAADGMPEPTNDDPIAGFAATVGRRINALEQSLFEPLEFIIVQSREAAALLQAQADRLEQFRVRRVGAEEIRREHANLQKVVVAAVSDDTLAVVEMIDGTRKLQLRNVDVIERHGRTTGT